MNKNFEKLTAALKAEKDAENALKNFNCVSSRNVPEYVLDRAYEGLQAKLNTAREEVGKILSSYE